MAKASVALVTAVLCAACVPNGSDSQPFDGGVPATVDTALSPGPATSATSSAVAVVSADTATAPAPTRVWPDVQLRYVQGTQDGGSELIVLSMSDGARESVALCRPPCTVESVATDGDDLAYVVQDSDADDLVTSRVLHRLAVGMGVAEETPIPVFAMSLQAPSPSGDRLLLVRARDAHPAPVPETSVWVIGDDEQQVGDWGNFHDALGWLSEDVVVYSKAATGTPPCAWTTYRLSLADGRAVDIGGGRAVAIAPGRDRIAAVDDQECNASQSLHLFDADGAGRLDLGTTDAYVKAVSWSPDGSRLAADVGGALHVYDVSTGDVVASHVTAPGYAADSTWLDDRVVVFHQKRTIDAGWLRALDVETGAVDDIEPVAPGYGNTFLHTGQQ